MVEITHTYGKGTAGITYDFGPHDLENLPDGVTADVKAISWMVDATKEIKRLRAIIAELAEYSGELGVTESTLSLWADGKCIGAPEFPIGVATPLTCDAIARKLRANEKANG